MSCCSTFRHQVYLCMCSGLYMYYPLSYTRFKHRHVCTCGCVVVLYYPMWYTRLNKSSYTYTVPSAKRVHFVFLQFLGHISIIQSAMDKSNI